jgi:3-phenylpropionate/trans-cinnamate dioxygenase ferredoxin subunit
MTERWIDVGAEANIVGTRPLTADIDGTAVIVVRCPEGYFAVEDRCTHDGEPLAGAEVEDCEIICPRHFARFSLKTGEALTPPAYEPVRTFNVRTENGRILVLAPD